MYRVLIADDDILMREALGLLISREEKFQVIHVCGNGESAVKACKEGNIHIAFLDMLMPGITGLDASWMIHQSSPEISIYLLTSYSANILIRGLVSESSNESVKDVLEKPISQAQLRKILERYKTEHEDSVQDQMDELAEILRSRNFNQFYKRLPTIIDELYENFSNDSVRLIKIFTYIGQSLLEMRGFYVENQNIAQAFPLNEALILDRKISEMWLFRVIDYLFQQNSINRYPLLENIFNYMEANIKKDITLNRIIENCAISQGYLSRIVREQFQLSVTEYIHLKKMHLAKGYFYFTDDSIAEVAFKLGYNESSYFSKVFKKYENMTVKQYKSGIRK